MKNSSQASMTNQKNQISSKDIQKQEQTPFSPTLNKPTSTISQEFPDLISKYKVSHPLSSFNQRPVLKNEFFKKKQARITNFDHFKQAQLNSVDAVQGPSLFSNFKKNSN